MLNSNEYMQCVRIPEGEHSKKVKLAERNFLILVFKVLKCRRMSHIIRRKFTDEHVVLNCGF